VTGVAGLREIRRHVIGIGRALEILQVAGNTGRAIQTVVVVDVAIGAQPRWHHVQAGQIEARGRVVEGAIGPEVGVVAVLARGRESGCRVRHRGGCVVVIVLVARHATCVRNRVVVVDVAVGTSARRHRVTVGQREA